MIPITMPIGIVVVNKTMNDVTLAVPRETWDVDIVAPSPTPSVSGRFVVSGKCGYDVRVMLNDVTYH